MRKTRKVESNPAHQSEVIDHSILSSQNKEVKRQDWTASNGEEFSSGRDRGEVCACLATKNMFRFKYGIIKLHPYSTPKLQQQIYTPCALTRMLLERANKI